MKRLLLSALLACLTACFDTSSTRVSPDVRQTNSRAGLAGLLDPKPRLDALSSEPYCSRHAWLAPVGFDVNAVPAGYLTPRLKVKGLITVPLNADEGTALPASFTAFVAAAAPMATQEVGVSFLAS